MKRRAPILLLALLLDALLSDPPNRWHPVAWMGGAIARAQRHAPPPDAPPARQMLYGGGIVVAGAAGVSGMGALLVWLIARLPRPLGWLLEALLLNTTFSLRGLTRAAGQISDALDEADLPAARRWLSWHLVSRNTAALDASQVAAAAIESVAENASDGVIAPLLFYAIGGLPAALAYRFLNTADAMLGYRDAAREWLGKVPARLDDAANLIPARLTALLILLTTPLTQGNIRQAWRVWRRDAGKTASPNAGHPMSAMAGALGVRLEKTNNYALGDNLRPPQPADISRAVRLTRIAVAAGAAFSLLLLLIPSRRP